MKTSYVISLSFIVIIIRKWNSP